MSNDWKLKTAELTEEQFDDRDKMMEPFFITGPTDDDWFGGVRHYSDLDAATLKQLIAKGYADPEERQNRAPSIGEILEVIDRCPELTAHGYVVSRDRDDARISIEGVEGNCPLDDALFFREADEFSYQNGEFYCWYD